MYPNSGCNCSDAAADLDAPSLCTDQCAEVTDTDCVVYSGTGIGTPEIFSTDDTLTAILTTIASELQAGVSGLTPAVTVSSPPVVNTVAVGSPAAATVTDSDAGTDMNLVFTFDIPVGATGATPTMTETSTTSVALADSGSVTLNYTSDPLLTWVNGQRIRAWKDNSNYMEGVISSVSATSVTFVADYKVGSGTYNAWSIFLTGDVGAGATATCDAAGGDSVTIVAYNAAAAVTVTNTGTTSAATFQFDFDIPAPMAIASAALNGTQIEFTYEDATTLLVTGSVVGPGVPIGGTAGQVLVKIDATNYNTTWEDYDPLAQVPAGGADNAFLRKTAAADYNMAWEEIMVVEAPTTPTGNLVPIVFASTEAELTDAINQFNATEAGYSGAIIKLTADIVLTTSVTFDMDGIEIHGNGVWKIDHNNAGTPYTITINGGSPLFKDVVFADTSKEVAPGAGAGTDTRIFDIQSGAGAEQSVVKFERCVFDNIAQGNSPAGSSIYLTSFDNDSRLVFDGCSIISTLAIDAGAPNSVAIRLSIEMASAQDNQIIITDMKWLNMNGPQGTGTTSAVATVRVSSIYFDFVGSLAKFAQTLLDIDMESYAFSLLNGWFGASDATNVYIRNSAFHYGDNNESVGQTLKPNEFGTFGWNNASEAHPLNHAGYEALNLTDREYYWCDDFDYGVDGTQLDVHQTANTVRWTVGAGAGHAAANQLLQVEDNGGIAFTTGAVANNSEQITNINKVYTDRNPVFEVRFKVKVVTTTTSVGYFGLVDVANPLVNANFNAVTTSYIMVGVDTGEANPDNIRLLSDNAGATGAPGLIEDLGVTATADSYVTVRVDLTDLAQPRVWVNTTGGQIESQHEIAAALITATIPAATIMYPCIFAETLAGSAAVVTVDYFKVWQDRS